MYSRVRVKVKKWSHFRGELPQYESLQASGLDVRAQISEDWYLEPGERLLIPTGLSVEIPQGFEIQVRPRSGLALREGLGLLNSPGTIDADYRGEIKIIVVNLGQNTIKIHPGDRIAQLVLCPVIQLEWDEGIELNETLRGTQGFGSTGVSV